MRRLRSGWPGLQRLLRLTGPHTVGEELDDELRFHLEERIDELMEAGLARSEAEAEARRRFGDLAQVKEACTRIERPARRRRARSEAMAAWAADLRHAARALRQRPGFTLVMVLTLALGIGANTALFSAMESVLLRPLPVEGLERLVVLQSALPGQGTPRAGVSLPEALDLLRRDDLFQEAGAYEAYAFALTGQGEARKVSAALTLGDLFGVFGTRPHVGRLYGPGEGRAGAPQVVVLGHALWRELSGGDPAFIGRTLMLDEVPHEVIGVLAPDFRFPREAQLFTPYRVAGWELEAANRGVRYTTAVARLHPGLTPERLAAGLQQEASRWHAVHGPHVYPPALGHALLTQPFREWLAGELRPLLLVLMGAVALVLLIACANEASLQLVRTVVRSRELAVRAALGAGRWPLMRQLLVESLLLAGLGGLAGLGLGALLVQALRTLDPAQHPALQALALDRTVLAFTAALTLLVALLAGIAPALRAARAAPGDALKEGGVGSTQGVGQARLLRAGVVVQVALTLLLLLGSGLTLRSLLRLLQTDPGFRASGVLSLRMALPQGARDSAAQRVAFFSEVLERLHGLPGVEEAGLVSEVPFTSRRESLPFFLPTQRDVPAGAETGHADARSASAGYFRAMGIPLLRGRLFDGREAPEGPREVVIDEQLARQYFPREDPVGQQLHLLRERHTVIGVVGHVSHGALGELPKATFYLSPRQAQPFELSAVLSSALPPDALATAARAALGELAPEVPVYEVHTLESLVRRSLGARPLAVAVLGAFAGVSLLLALLGLYGVVSYGARERSRELGIRLALGAQPADLVRLVLRGALVLVVWGVGLGLLLFAALGRSLEAAFSGIQPLDAPVICLAIVLVALSALTASSLPARRAGRLAATSALRPE